MNNVMNSAINRFVVAPVIRQRYARGEVAPVVRFLGEQAQSDALHLDRAESVEALLAALPASMPGKVSMAGAGTFSVAMPPRTGRLEGKIVIVTGSAQGFGEGIASELLKHGCFMVYADLNLELAQQNADRANQQYGEGTAIAVSCDVSSEEAVEKMVQDTVDAFGGLDMFVANAGIAISGSLDELEMKTFELITKVNYTAFFVCAKHAARVMRLQRQCNLEATADIIQINSKSGLEGSNKNFAYSGSKFGGIGLTQSFAKELVEYGIKVNAICPGNYLEGPLWMHPEKGLFVQYLRSGKVPDAQNTEDVKRFYEAKVPMNRGCFPVDVARAILYCAEQKYETGQAIPVTGGQNMLS